MDIKIKNILIETRWRRKAIILCQARPNHRAINTPQSLSIHTNHHPSTWQYRYPAISSPISIPLTGMETSRAVTRSFRTCVEFPWQKTDSNPAPVAFRLIEELNNRNCFLRLCSRAIVEDTRAWPRKAWLPSRSRIKGSKLHAHPVLYVCICISYPRVCVETAVLTTPFDGSGNPPRLFVYKAS